jgi:RNA polymerase sigma-70 factor, ECF subfamily
MPVTALTERAALDRWMAAAADGDRRAIAPLFHALWPTVVRYAARMLGDPSLAEDCAQDTLVQLFGQLERYEHGRDALTWALTLATWQCRTLRRRRHRRGEQPAASTGERLPHGTHGAPGGRDAGSLTIDGASLLEHRDLVRAALATLGTLSPRDIETITLAITDTDRADTTPATFRKRLERALSRFRTSWRSRHGTL